MSGVTTLLSFGLRQVIGEGAGSLAEVLQRHCTDHSQALPKALAAANDRAWQALSLALAGDGLFDGFKDLFRDADLKAVREDVRAFLDGQPTLQHLDGRFRKSCLAEIDRARRAGRLSAEGRTASDLAEPTGHFQRFSDPQGLIAGAGEVVLLIARDLQADYPNLAKLLQLPTGGPPLLVSAFAFFLRRRIATDQELANELVWDGVQQLCASQAAAFERLESVLDGWGPKLDQLLTGQERIEAGILDLHAEMEQLGTLHLSNAGEVRALLHDVVARLDRVNMGRGEVKPQHSFSIRSEDERRAIKLLLERFRHLSPQEQEQVPALLNGLGKLQVGIGDYSAAQQTFAEVAAHVQAPSARAEAHFNAYRAALEQKQWDAAFQELLRAAELDAARFAPFSLLRYQPQRLLGAGGFGAAILCHDANFAEDVVLKTLHAADMERSLTDVFREARLLHRLNHPALINVRECDYADPVSRSRPYIIMQYFPGVTLEAWIAEHGPLPVADLVAVARQIAEGMQAAHREGVLHRDLKPANVLVRQVSDHWQVKIIDFGLALRRATVETSVVAHSQRNTLTSESAVGTLDYAPPEQLGRLPGVQPGPYSDVYSFGKLCCHALFRTTEPKKRHWATIPEALAELLEGCTEAELEHRVPSFDRVLTTLADLTAEPLSKQDAPAPQPKLTEVLSQIPITTTGVVVVEAREPPTTRAPQPGEIQEFPLANGVSMRMAFVPRGTFWKSGQYQNAQEQATIPHDFYLGIYPVTQEQWQAVMGTNPSNFSRPTTWFTWAGAGEYMVGSVPDADLKQFPVERVLLSDAQKFVKKLNANERNSDWVYRLPTLEEWEYACRGGVTSREDCSFDFYFDHPTNDLSSHQANFNGKMPARSAAEGPNRGRTTKVGSYPPNRLGLYDMHGNVWEMCQSSGPLGLWAGRRGGSYCSDGMSCKAGYIVGLPPAPFEDTGFRLARVPSGSK